MMGGKREWDAVPVPLAFLDISANGMSNLDLRRTINIKLEKRNSPASLRVGSRKLAAKIYCSTSRLQPDRPYRGNSACTRTVDRCGNPRRSNDLLHIR